MRGVSTDRAPERGCLLAIFDDVVVFEPYRVLDGRLVYEGCEALADKMPIRCHLFDQDTEYRMVARASRGDCIEQVFSVRDEDGLDPDLLYVDTMLVQGRFVKPGVPDAIKVVNRYRYTDGDTLVLDTYRLGWQAIEST